MEERKPLPIFTGEYGPEVHQVLIPDSLAALGKHTQKTSLRSVLNKPPRNAPKKKTILEDEILIQTV